MLIILMTAQSQKILVLGGTGLLGSHLLSGKYLLGYDCVSQGRGLDADIQVDLLNPQKVCEMLTKLQPVAIINLVALTNVDLCESMPNNAYQVNARTLQHIVDSCRKLDLNPRLIHISSDHLYDGNGPHQEDAVNLTNYYAFSKYTAELVASTVKSVILRTNFFGKSRILKRESFSDWIFKELTLKNNILVFSDVLFSPLSLHTLCRTIELLVDSNITGIYNLGSHNGMSKADFAFKFANTLCLSTENMTRVNSTDVSELRTYRPKDMRLNVDAIENVLGIKLPNLDSEIEQVALEYIS